MSTVEHISLSQLTSEIEDVLQSHLERTYWVVAEISECNANYSGHCYLELIEKPEQSEQILAKIRATIWAQKYGLISTYFKAATGVELQAGLKVLFRVSVEYHKLYGMSLNIKDVDPTYTLGEDEKQRREILERLEDEGILEMNSEVVMAEVPQTLAIISSPQAAGYQDFIEQLTHNDYGICFNTKLFPASMQGLEVEKSVVAALDKIYAHEDVFDAVIIIRGGGSKTDLRWFDNYNIAANIAQFPLPVVSGIGHDKDQSIVDIVSHTSLKTPTAVADFFIAKAADVLGRLEVLEEEIISETLQFLQEERKSIDNFSFQLSHIVQSKFKNEYLRLQALSQDVSEASKSSLFNQGRILDNFAYRVQSNFNRRIQTENNKLDNLSRNIQFETKSIFSSNAQKLELLEAKLQSYNPQKILEQGYSITTNSKGELITNSADLKPGDVVKTTLNKGSFESEVRK